MANKFKHPFGANLNPVFFRKKALKSMIQGGSSNTSTPSKFDAYQPSALYEIDTLYSSYDHKWKRIETISGCSIAMPSAVGACGPHHIKLSVDEYLPAGAMLFINYQQTAAGATGLKLGTKFWTGTGGMRSVGGQTTAKGTGLWAVGFIYNGTNFVPFGRDNLNLGYEQHPLVSS